MQKSSVRISLQARHLAEYISDWINIYVPRMRGCSPHTERAYRTSLSLYVSYLEGKGYTVISKFKWFFVILDRKSVV